MIVALFALAATMIVAGATAVVEGFPYVRLESGMAMVYGGSVVGSSGLLLLGLAVVATGLKRVERAVRSGLTLASESPPAVDEAGNDPFADELQVIAPSPVERPRIEPSLSPVAERDRIRQVEPEPAAPGLSLIELAEEKIPEVRSVPRGEPVAAPRSLAAAPAPEDPADLAPLRSSLDMAHEPAAHVPAAHGPAAHEPAAHMPPPHEPHVPPPHEEKPERTAVGRYSSGGNTYVMFDDGAIEADTPNGRFTFASLDELKAFVDGGGERDARGAA